MAAGFAGDFLGYFGEGFGHRWGVGGEDGRGKRGKVKWRWWGKLCVLFLVLVVVLSAGFEGKEDVGFHGILCDFLDLIGLGEF